MEKSEPILFEAPVSDLGQQVNKPFHLRSVFNRELEGSAH